MNLLSRLLHRWRYGPNPETIQLATDQDPKPRAVVPRYLPFALQYNAVGGPANNIHPLTLGICVALMHSR